MDKNIFAPLPPRGWNSYDYYDTTVTEADIRANADFMAEHLRPFGYEYVVIDIQWYAPDAGTRRSEFQYIPFGPRVMDEYGRFLPCPRRFPSSAGGAGFRPLADYIHSKGLKFGIHIMRGLPREAAHRHLKVFGTDVTADAIADPGSICDWNPDMYGLRDCPASQAYYDSIIDLYARWGVDFIKVDDICNTHAYKDRPYMGRHEIEMLHKAIERCGRPMVLSLSPGPALIEQADHYCRYANMWRITDDFWDSWPLLRKMFDFCRLWQYVPAPGCWPDCDMLPVGTVGKGFDALRLTNFTKDEQQTMMVLWCLFRSPLMIGAELPLLDEWTLSLLCNRQLLALQEAPHRPRLVKMDETCAVWLTDDPDAGTAAVALFNFEDAPAHVETCVSEWNRVSRLRFREDDGVMTELLTHRKLSLAQGVCRPEVPAHGVRIFSLQA